MTGLLLALTLLQLPAILYTHAPEGAEPWPAEDISLRNADGTVRALTGDRHSHDPSWSPDGRRILFLHDSALQSKPAYKEQEGFQSYHSVELEVMDRDGGNRRLIRRLEPVIYRAVWSPDGKMLAVTCVLDGQAGLVLLPADGSGGLRMLVPHAFTPAWSPDSKRLAFSVETPRGQWAIHVSKADGTNNVELTSPGSQGGGSPAWSPDGKHIAFDRYSGALQQVFVMDMDGEEMRQLTASADWSCGHPSWSPDGKQLVFACRSASRPCGGMSSVGTVLPLCERRLFSLSLQEPRSKPERLTESDAGQPAVAPVR